MTRRLALRTNLRLASVLFATVLVFQFGCQSRVPPPEPEPKPAPVPTAESISGAAVVSNVAATIGSITPTAALSAAAVANAAPSASSSVALPLKASSAVAAPASAAPVRSVVPPGSDPLEGKFTLDDATKGLPKSGKLVAEMVTDSGTLKCELFSDKAPVTVANFVGLARGLRPFKDPKTSEWVKRPAYDDGVFHRIIKGFMIQGGDPLGTGAGEGGYLIPDEIWPGATHDRRGLLCMANRGKNTNSMQFFVTDAAAPHLDSGYTIFGSCGPDAVLDKLASTEVRGDRAVNPPKIKKVTVKRSK